MKYIMIIDDDGQRTYVGPFDTEQEAQDAAIKHVKRPSVFYVDELTAYDADNFPLSTSDLQRMKFKVTLRKGAVSLDGQSVETFVIDATDVERAYNDAAQRFGANNILSLTKQ
jgi:hypothetical protein